MLDYHKREKSQRKKQRRKKIFLLSALKIAYILLTYTPDTRFRFTKEYRHLAKVYGYLLEAIGNELNLPVKKCKLCKIKFLPDHRTKGHQECCPYGCVELNRKINKQIAKSRYRKKFKARELASQYNGRYRERLRNGQVCEVPEIKDIDLKEVERKLRNEIEFLYKKLNPEVSHTRLKQLDRILRKLSRKIYTS